jgi:hypothetical protein
VQIKCPIRFSPEKQKLHLQVLCLQFLLAEKIGRFDTPKIYKKKRKKERKKTVWADEVPRQSISVISVKVLLKEGDFP